MQTQSVILIITQACFFLQITLAMFSTLSRVDFAKQLIKLSARANLRNCVETNCRPHTHLCSTKVRHISWNIVIWDFLCCLAHNPLPFHWIFQLRIRLQHRQCFFVFDRFRTNRTSAGLLYPVLVIKPDMDSLEGQQLEKSLSADRTFLIYRSLLVSDQLDMRSLFSVLRTGLEILTLINILEELATPGLHLVGLLDELYFQFNLQRFVTIS